MKTIEVPKINVQELSAQALRDELMDNGAESFVDCVNWSDFPYAPNVKFRMGHTDTHLYVMFDVVEKHLLARYLNQNENVWEDSCVELFIADPDGRHYYNFETSCIGTGLAARRVSGPDAVMFTPEQMAKIQYFASLPHEAIDKKNNKEPWWLIVAVPFELVGYNSAPAELRGNVYKCGDGTETPHFLSWAPIDAPTPAFHLPQFFGKFILK